MSRASAILTVSLVLIGNVLTHGEDTYWPQWRGPKRDGVSTETGLLRSWNVRAPKLVWKASGLGMGYSSVVVTGGTVFTIGKRNGQVFAVALEVASGRLLWSREIGATDRMPSSTPTVDGERLYALDPDGDLNCLDSSSGEILWHKSFLDDFDGRLQSSRGYAESPLIDGDKLICTPGGSQTTLVALDKRTGRLLWQSAVPQVGPRGSDGAGFSSIVVTTAAGVRQYVQLIGRGLIGVGAKNGRFLWGYNRLANHTANIPTPVVRDNFVFAANGYNAGSALLKMLPDEKGGIKVEEVYFLGGGRFQNHHGGIVLVGDYIYGGHGSNNGLPTCIELKTGRILWKRRGPGTGSASIVYADGHLYFRYQNGIMALIEATSDGYKLKGTFKVPGASGDSWSHPVVAGGRLYLREKDRLSVYDVTAR